jgi:acetyltransferase-like isoleucine patch superfamily enzyme
MKSRWVIGSGTYLDEAIAAWKLLRPQENVVRIEVPQHADFEFDMGVLDGLNPVDGTMFVAVDDRFGNFKRTELMQAVTERGFRLEACVSASAIVAEGIPVGPNAFVGDGVVIGAGSRIDYNAVVHPGVKIGTNVHIRSSCWLELGVTVGSGAKIGAHSIVRMGAMVAPNVKVGRGCDLGWAQVYKQDVPDKTTYDSRYDEPIRVFGN